ncbi:TadE/TadG family type IV pilus assembly protein [Mesorhizobium sp. CAU 1741]|uniref:TadE/TadG family type IV pilus assembly protein n=1 Tax=Mesorhizobium sp. CAU 1741 TaxID=3140366 RepID=UPI00325A48B8
MNRTISPLRPHLPFRDSSGSTAVEFALLCPLYLLLIMGMTAYGVYFGTAHSVQQIAADAARVAVAGLDSLERQQLATGFVQRHAGGYLFIDVDNVSVSVGDDPADRTQFNVIVSYDASELPIWALHERLAMPAKTIERRSTIRIGGI